MITALLLLAAAACAQEPSGSGEAQGGAERHEYEVGDQLLENPGFKLGAKAWALRDAEPAEGRGRLKGDAVLLHAQPPAAEERGAEQHWAHAGVWFDHPPVGRRLHFRCHARGAAPQQLVAINAFSYDADGRRLQKWSTAFPAPVEDWGGAATEYVLDPRAERFTLWMINLTRAEILLSDASLIVGRPAQARLESLSGAGLLRASSAVTVKPREPGVSGRITFPIPGRYRDQVPLSFDLTCDPATALRTFRWRLREDGINWLCEVLVKPPKEGATVRWESLVLVPASEVVALPPITALEVPDFGARWLTSTASVQAQHPEIQSAAADLGSRASDLRSFAEEVAAFAAENSGDSTEALTACDAVQALHRGGTSPCRANLAAALLRSHGVPARTVSHLPVWPGATEPHWLVEYWHPGPGWVWLEPTLGRMQPPDWSLVVLAVSNPEDEERSLDPTLSRCGFLPGVAEYSVPCSSEQLETVALPRADRLTRETGSWAEPVMRIPADYWENKWLKEAAVRNYEVLRDQGERGFLDQSRSDRLSRAGARGDARHLRQVLEDLLTIEAFR